MSEGRRETLARRDARLMGLALRVAREGRPSPNPHVGAVIARDDDVIAVGHHERAGEAHAEVAALARAGERARGASLYVTFEPCNHFGRTPPCTDAILAAGVARVVVGCRDTAPHVPGAIEKLRAAGVEVVSDVRRDEALRLVADFTKHITTGLPFVTAKAAVTLDGRIATRRGESRWITGARARAEAHRLRDRSDAVLVGVGTVLADDPALTVRAVPGRTPLRVVLDSTLRTPPDARLLREGEGAPVLVFHGPEAAAARRRALEAAGAELVEVPERTTGGGLALEPVLRALGDRDVVRLLVEGGGAVLGSLLGAGHVDRCAFFVAPVLLGDAGARPVADGPALESLGAALRLVGVRIRRLGDDVLVVGDAPRRPHQGDGAGRAAE